MRGWAPRQRQTARTVILIAALAALWAIEPDALYLALTSTLEGPLH